jgi:hypothetical protein
MSITQKILHAFLLVAVFGTFLHYGWPIGLAAALLFLGELVCWCIGRRGKG